jgi:hypothetical protein
MWSMTSSCSDRVAYAQQVQNIDHILTPVYIVAPSILLPSVVNAIEPATYGMHKLFAVIAARVESKRLCCWLVCLHLNSSCYIEPPYFYWQARRRELQLYDMPPGIRLELTDTGWQSSYV